jgi:pimeloyl-ACP methyl ester carboxylesterase
VKAFRFGPPGREIYGVFHAPASAAWQGRAVLLCNPFAQEAVRTHRLYRVLADRLAREGFAVMRFDYLGTGESAGDGVVARLARFCADVVAADRELRSRAGATETIWIGARLGASVAAMASVGVERAPKSLVLWEPIANGRDYVRELGAVPFPAAAEGGADGRVSEVDVRGYLVSAELVADIAALDSSVIDRASVERVCLMYGGPVPAEASSVSRVAVPGVPTVESEGNLGSFDWNAEEAMNTEVVPRLVVDRLLHRAMT